MIIISTCASHARAERAHAAIRRRRRSGDGCGKELAWWFTPEGRHPPPSHARPLLVADLPRACAALAAAPAKSAAREEAR